MKGLKVVGIAGGASKCEFVKKLGADYCLDYKQPDLGKRIKEVVPGGVDFFFDNVGEDVLDAVLPAMSQGGKVLLCGAIATYANWKERKGILNHNLAITKALEFKGIVFFN